VHEKQMPFLRDSRRCGARAVKAAVFAFTGAKRMALTGAAGGAAQSLGRKGFCQKEEKTSVELFYGKLA
jgi:hypothetical protein